MVAETTGGSQRRLKLSGSLSRTCERPKPSVRGCKSEKAVNSTEIQRLYEADAQA
jgi:hypothetical protein